MRTKIAIAALVAGASAASAQNFSLEFVAPTTVDATAQSSFDVLVVANADVGTHVVSGAFAMTGTDASGTIAGMTWTNSAWAPFSEVDGWQGGADYGRIVYGQLVLPGVPPFDVPHPDSALDDVIIGMFTIDLTGLTGTIDLQLTFEDPHAIEVYDVNNPSGLSNSSEGTLTLGSATITVVPAPTSAAMLGLGGFAAARRRR